MNEAIRDILLWQQKQDEDAAERMLERMKGAILQLAADVWRKSDQLITRDEAQAALRARCFKCMNNWKRRSASPTSYIFQCLLNEARAMLNEHTKEVSKGNVSIEDLSIAEPEPNTGPDRMEVLKMIAKLAPLSDKEKLAIAWVLAGKPRLNMKQEQRHAGYLLFMRCRAERLGLLRVKRHA